MRATITLSIALLSALVLLSACSQQSRIAAQAEPTAQAESADACVKRVQAQYERISEHTLKGRQDAYETAVLLCKF